MGSRTKYHGGKGQLAVSDGGCKSKVNFLVSYIYYRIIMRCHSKTKYQRVSTLDYIDDLHGSKDDSQKEQAAIFERVDKYLSNEAVGTEIVYQGGLGHPMRVFDMPGELRVIFKDSRKGAWYSRVCHSCEYFPCHDALMALRVTPAGSFQLCLLNEKLHWNFNAENIKQKFDSIMKIYTAAYFIGSDNIENNSINPPEN